MSENNQNSTEEIVLSVEMSDSISAQAAEAWAVGQRGGVDVAETDPTWHNNAKYYAEQCADAEQAAQAAEDAAEQAESAKTAAEAARDRAEAIGAGAVQSATAAAESAQAAATAKTGAETAQSAAAGSATAAEGAAGRASQSATAAGQSATDAGTAKTAAEAARDAAAGSASAAGQSAQAAAASAQAAEDVAESIPADYSQLSDDVSGLKSAINTKAPAIYPTASGTIATFPDGADGMPLKSLAVHLEPVQSGSGDPSPTNVRPISGHSGTVNVTRYGSINVWDEVWELGSISSATGQDGSSSQNIRSKNYIAVLPGETYYCFYASEDSSLVLRMYGKTKNYLGSTAVKNNTKVIPDDVYFIRFVATGITEYANNISINYPATDTEYHPYVGQTYPIALPASAGTVYGGMLDVVSGKLIVDRVLLSTTWGDGGSETTYEDRKRRRWFLPVGQKSNPALPAMCNLAVQSSAVTAPLNRFSLHNNGDFIYLSLAPDTANSTEIQFCYYLASPSDPIPLTPTDIQTILGYNAIWSDSGAVEVEYPADTKTYIDNRINSTRKLIAGIETGFVASKAYAVGDMLIIGDDLYKVAASIASGATITVGTNVTKTTVAEQLLALANA